MDGFASVQGCTRTCARTCARICTQTPQFVQLGQRLADGAVAAQPTGAVGLALQTQDGRVLRVLLGQKVRHVQPGFGGQAGGALKQQRLLRGVPLGLHKQPAKGRVRFIGQRVGQGHFKSRDELDLDRLLAAVVQLHLPKLDVVFRADPDGDVGLQLGPGGVEAHPVGVKHAAVAGRRVGRGMLRDGHRRIARAPPNVEKTAAGVAQCIVAQPGDAQRTQAAAARAIGAQGDAVAAVGQQLRGLDRLLARQDLAQQRWQTAQRGLRGLACGGHVQQRDLARRPLVQQ